MQFLAMAIREASVILVSEISNSFNPVQFSEMEMILPSVIWSQPHRINNSSPVQLVDIDMMLASDILSHSSRFKDTDSMIVNQCNE